MSQVLQLRFKIQSLLQVLQKKKQRWRMKLVRFEILCGSYQYKPFKFYSNNRKYVTTFNWSTIGNYCEFNIFSSDNFGTNKCDNSNGHNRVHCFFQRWNDNCHRWNSDPKCWYKDIYFFKEILLIMSSNVSLNCFSQWHFRWRNYYFRSN